MMGADLPIQGVTDLFQSLVAKFSCAKIAPKPQAEADVHEFHEVNVLGRVQQDTLQDQEEALMLAVVCTKQALLAACLPLACAPCRFGNHIVQGGTDRVTTDQYIFWPVAKGFREFL